MGFSEDNGIDTYFGDESNNLGEFYHNNYNVFTISEAIWKMADGKEIKFGDMKEKHILNCIKMFKKDFLLVGVFKLELFRRELQSLIDIQKLKDSFDTIHNTTSYEEYHNK